jgi:hypothetical protein
MTITREQWLQEAVNLVDACVFTPHDIKVPQVRVSVGWPSRGGTANAKRVIGQCWKGMVAADGIHHVFLSPMLGAKMEMLETLVHELIHAIDDCESGHKGNVKNGTGFAGMARKVGLVGKLTATSAGEELMLTLAKIADQLGDFDHSPLRPTAGVPKQSTRMLKVECPEDGYTIRTTQKWIDMGLPSCPCGEEMVQA